VFVPFKVNLPAPAFVSFIVPVSSPALPSNV